MIQTLITCLGTTHWYFLFMCYLHFWHCFNAFRSRVVGLPSLAPYPLSWLTAIVGQRSLPLWVKGHKANITSSKSILLCGMLRSIGEAFILHPIWFRQGWKTKKDDGKFKIFAVSQTVYAGADGNNFTVKSFRFPISFLSESNKESNLLSGLVHFYHVIFLLFQSCH